MTAMERKALRPKVAASRRGLQRTRIGAQGVAVIKVHTVCTRHRRNPHRRWVFVPIHHRLDAHLMMAVELTIGYFFSHSGRAK